MHFVTPSNGRMCPVGGTESIAYIQIGQISQLLAELLAVLSLFLAAETGILKQYYVSVFHCGNCCCCGFACYIVISYKVYFPAKFFGQSPGNGRQ